ncbi:ROK family protein [Cohnella lubricantis]|uniref:ROK family protein n=1 Tax=Cohnella lubricantis TaxID=2163172 RepID=A0A841TET0_9BACL|nr:ROK family protein [Cohnella lubricantis]MBB6678489.1 ROK family protein [Cohnella lubricantis]MBP2118412.1 glucokinase [Cohnella lubricantis]
MAKVIGIDIGGTSIKGIVADGSGRVCLRDQAATNAAGGREAILAAVESLVARLRNGCPEAEAIGIATAGRVNADAGVVFYATDNLPGWMGMELKPWAEARFGLPAAAENDGNAALLGEVWLGAGVGKKHLIMLTLGTGVGGANMSDGELVRGARWSGGEWGHSVLVPGGLICNCGRRGCLEQYVSATALARMAGEAAGKRYAGSREVMADAAAGNAAALEAAARHAQWLALAIGSLQEGFDPEAFIIGGGFAAAGTPWWAMLEQALKDSRSPAAVLPAKLGGDAGAYGAAALALRRLGCAGETAEAVKRD